MKRNSCTQTAPDASDAYSRTGGEIVSACRARNSTVKRIAVGVQTLSREILPMPAATMQSDERNTKYTSSPTSHFPGNAKCRDQTCQKHNAQVVQRACARCTNQSSSDTTKLRKAYIQRDTPIVTQQTEMNYASDDGATSTEPTYHRAAQSNSVQHKQKEAKNQINTSKSKCNCSRVAHLPVNDNKYGSNIGTKRLEYHKKTLFTKCPLCSKQKPVVESNNDACNCGACQNNPLCTRENNSGDGKAYVHASECDDVSDVNDADRRIVIGKSRQNCNADGQSRRALNFNEQNGIRNCDCTNDYTACQPPETTAETLCECSSSSQLEDNELCRFEYWSKIAERQPLTQIYSDSSHNSKMFAQQRKVQSSLRCNCDEACSCSNNQGRDIVRIKTRRSCVSKPNFVDDGDINRMERNCKHCRMCGAMYKNTRKCDCRQTFPKAVAYELSFTKENTMRNETSDINQIPPKGPFAKQPSNTTKTDTCPCDIIKRNGSNKNPHQTATLQVKFHKLVVFYSLEVISSFRI